MTGLPEVHLSSLAYTVMHWLPRTYESESRDPFDLNAPYQRGSVWTLAQRQALIKSLYMGLPVGSVIVSHLPHRSEFSYRIVDGKQRIETVRAFAEDKFPIPYEWLREDDRPATEVSMCPQSGVIFHSEASERFRRWFGMGAQMSALEFKPELEWMGRNAKGQSQHRKRSDAEILRVEAELYGLINGGGTPQTEDDMARAALIAEGVR